MENKLDIYLFHRGEHRKAYNYMGAHFTQDGAIFRVWAPHAKSVLVVGDFNNWDGSNHKMKKINAEGIWELEIKDLKKYDLYKFKVEQTDGKIVFKADPYGFYSEKRPKTASILYDIPQFRWTDGRWMNKRNSSLDNPINIYEVHLGSWKRDENGNWLNYNELAHKLCDYVKEMNYTHIEIMPINEYPLDDSWGYQGTGFYSVTSRYGNPEDFMYFINHMHKHNIGVILDWVPGHFCKDEHGLYKFDGTPTYEYADIRLGENREWGTCNFDLSRNEVKSFLISNVNFWFEVFHIDGLRIDAVANMLYLPTLENDDVKNKYGGKENLDAVEFFKNLNLAVDEDYPQCMIIGEDSTAWPGVTKKIAEGGLGFDSKWNMGWMNDTLKYFEIDPIFRKNHHGKITFSFMYAFSENYLLPLSHDEVVHGKKSILNKMPGFLQAQMANVRSLYAYQILHPGKKLNFMGNEFAQGLEWRFYQELEWYLLDKEENRKMSKFTKDLNKLYLKERALWKDTGDTFEWIEHENHDGNMIIFMRKSEDEHIIGVFNFSGEAKKEYKVGVPEYTRYRIIINSDDTKYGGTGFTKRKIYTPLLEEWNFRKQHIEIDIQGNSVIFLKGEKRKKKLD